MKKILCLLFFMSIIRADVYDYQLEELVGWTIVGVKTIEGSKEPNQSKKNDFEGCNGDTTIFFQDGTIAKCISLGLQLNIMPKAVIFARNVVYKGKKMTIYKMLVDNNIYNIYY